MTDTSLTDRDRIVRVPAGREDLRTAAAGADVPVAGVGPTGVRGLDPLVTATIGGRTAFYPDCGADRATEVASALADGDLVTDGAAVVEHDPRTTTLPAPDLGGLNAGTRRLLGGCGWRRPASPEDHRAAGGFHGDDAGTDVDANADVDADASTDADEILALAADLRGRGWGDWRHDEPIGGDWERLREDDRTDDGDGAAVVVNAHGTDADVLLAESVPFEPLEGAQLAARAVDADGIVVYLSEAAERAAERVRAAADAYPDPAAPVEVVTGPPIYRAAEPTMALEAIEGNHRLEARLRPAGELPTLHGTPALVHTARTYAHLAVGLRTGDPADPETRLVTVSGDVEAPATVELPGTATLDRALDAVALTDGFKAACVGGRFGGLTGSLDVGADPDVLVAAGLGTEGVVEVLSTDRCILEFVGERTQFASETNCGRCVPCREGSKQLADLLRGIYDGDYDDDAIAELVRVMEGSSICEFGVNAGRPARTAMDAFGAEFEAHADGRCPAGACTETAHAEVQAEVHQ